MEIITPLAVRPIHRQCLSILNPLRPAQLQDVSATLIGQIRHFAASIRPSPTRVEQSKKIYMSPELKTCSHIFVKQDPIKPNLTQPYFGPYLVVSRTDKTFRVLNNDRIMSDAINNVKPCFQLNNAEDTYIS